MTELVQDNWILFVLVLLVGLAVAWWIFAASRRTRVQLGRDAAEGGPAKRNQALIDAPPAIVPEAVSPPATPAGLAGVGEAVSAAAVPAAAPPAKGATDDDLTRIKGLGPKLAEQLRGLGVVRFAQIAEWTDADVDRIDAQLGRFAGRIRRDNWQEQARFLAAEDTAGYEARFGKL